MATANINTGGSRDEFILELIDGVRWILYHGISGKIRAIVAGYLQLFESKDIIP